MGDGQGTHRRRRRRLHRLPRGDEQRGRRLLTLPAVRPLHRCASAQPAHRAVWQHILQHFGEGATELPVWLWPPCDQGGEALGAPATPQPAQRSVCARLSWALCVGQVRLLHGWQQQCVPVNL